jgi:hypothetical protein
MPAARATGQWADHQWRLRSSVRASGRSVRKEKMQIAIVVSRTADAE